MAQVPSQSTCSGCGHTYSIRGLASHLRQTRNPRCRLIFEFQSSYLPNDEHSSSPLHLPDDFFGGEPFSGGHGPDDVLIDEPNMDNIPDPRSKTIVDDFSDSESELDDFEREIEAAMEDGWEPPPDEAQDYEAEDPPLAEEPYENPPAASTDRSTVHDALQNPPYMERFNDIVPNANAGKLFSENQDVNSSYRDDLFNNTTTWAPFTSKIDWEIARWSKLRGPSSTAFSDLLKIDGV